ncbi:hypothetical protein [Streptomyces milbemycinicus]|uniref:hypothetical protein n=1 Tax=Streptomyces milbemycinicus TaxID=476552 RepID=UPI0033EDCE52
MTIARRPLGRGPHPQAPVAPQPGTGPVHRVSATEADVERADATAPPDTHKFICRHWWNAAPGL